MQLNLIRAGNSADRLIHAIADVEILAAAGRGKQRRISILAYTGGVMNVPGWGSVVIDLAGLEYPPQVPLLADHDTRLDSIVGHGKAAIGKGRLSIAGTLARTATSQLLVQLADDGFTFHASVGVQPVKTRMVEKGEVLTVNNQTITAERPLLLVIKGRLAEVSIVGVGADARTAVSIAANAGRGGAPPEGYRDPPADPSAGDDPILAERDRTSRILRAAHAHPRIAARAIDEGWDVQRTELEILRASRPQAPAVGGEAPGYAGDDISGAARVLACAALLHAGSHTTAEKSFGAQLCAQAADLRITSSLDLCRAALMLDLREVPRDRSEMIRASFSTSTLSGALAAATQREAMTAFVEAPSAWRMIARTRPAPDFRERQGLRPYLKGGALEEIPADGEIKHAAPSEDTYPFQVRTFAKMFGIDRKTIINDDIGAVFELLRELGRQAARSIASEVATLILTNPDNFFHADNGNYITGAGTALSIDGLTLAVQALREQTDSDDQPIDVSPKTLLVPPALEAVGRQVLKSTGVLLDTEAQAPSGNPWTDVAQLAVDPRFASAPAAWYLFADPANVPAVVVSFLNGKEGPTVEQDDMNFNMLGRQFRCYIDFGVDLADPRGAVKAAGE